MSKWISGKEVTEEEIENSLKAIKENVCFKCTEHSDECSIAKAAEDIRSMDD